MLSGRRIGVVGSRTFGSYQQLTKELETIIRMGDILVSGGAVGADSMAQRFAKDTGMEIRVIYPNYATYGKGAAFIRNRDIVENSDLILAFYAKGRFKQGGTANTIMWADKMNVPYHEYEEI